MGLVGFDRHAGSNGCGRNRFQYASNVGEGSQQADQGCECGDPPQASYVTAQAIGLDPMSQGDGPLQVGGGRPQRRTAASAILAAGLGFNSQ